MLYVLLNQQLYQEQRHNGGLFISKIAMVTIVSVSTIHFIHFSQVQDVTSNLMIVMQTIYQDLRSIQSPKYSVSKMWGLEINLHLIGLIGIFIVDFMDQIHILNQDK